MLGGEYALTVMITRRCNMTCAHCSVESGPSVRTEPTEAEVVEWIQQAARYGVQAVRLTGGEPMLRPALALKLVREATRLGLSVAMTTNGFWGADLARARKRLQALKRAGLRSLTVSYDAYHAAFQAPEPVVHIAQAAEELSILLNINVVRGAHDASVADIVRRLGSSREARLRFYELQPVGRAREMASAAPSADSEGFGTSCAFPTVSDDGRLLACPGPAYFERPDSPLVVGSLASEPLARLLDRHCEDPILNVIRTRGPAGLRDEMRRTPGLEEFPFRSSYNGICDLCHHITRDDNAVARLRQRLSQAGARAEQVAARQVIAESRTAGEYSHSNVNGLGPARLFFEAALHPERGLDASAARILGHAHLDWRLLTKYLTACGLARSLVGLTADPALARWAPAFFTDEIVRHGIATALREAVQREAIAALSDGLASLGGRGVLLKGTALMMRTPADRATRSTSDVDLFAERRLAVRLRDHLLANGFEGHPGSRASALHHLEPIFFRGVPIEIHTRIMPAYWGLPEREMLATATPLPGSDTLATLAPEGFLLHAVTHLSASFFTCGLKTAWDVNAVIANPAFDWERLGNWSTMLRAPRSFWIPLRELAASLQLHVPQEFLKRASVDVGAERLAVIARRRLFTAAETLFELDGLTKTGLRLLMQDGWVGRANYLASILLFRAARPATWNGTVTRARRSHLWRQSWRHYLRYRRAVHPRSPRSRLD